MKKRNTNKSNTESAQASPAVMGLIGAMQQQLANMERKIDALLSKSLPAQPAERRFPTLFAHNAQQTHPAQRRDETKGNNFRERVMHKAVCADCRKECEVPFKPTGDRPVYCKDCFAKRRSGGSFKPKLSHAQAKPSTAPVQHIEKDKSDKASKPPRKKKPAPNKKKRV